MPLPNIVKAEWMRLQEAHLVLRSVPLRESRRSTRRLGACRFLPKRLPDGTRTYSILEITISSWVWEHNDINKPETQTQLLDTLRHEVAHALVGPEADHGYLWRQKCREIGANPERTVSMNQSGIKNHTTYKAVCGRCGKDYLSPVRRIRRICKCAVGLDALERSQAHLTYHKVKSEEELL